MNSANLLIQKTGNWESQDLRRTKRKVPDKRKSSRQKNKVAKNKIETNQTTFTQTLRTSRRKRHRRHWRNQKKNTKDHKEERQLYKQRQREIIQKIDRQLTDSFGFVADLSHTLRHNLAFALTQVPLSLFLSQPINPSFHNLCIQNPPPDHAALLLNLGLNFCLHQHYTTDHSKLNIALKRFRRDFYTKVF